MFDPVRHLPLLSSWYPRFLYGAYVLPLALSWKSRLVLVEVAKGHTRLQTILAEATETVADGTAIWVRVSVFLGAVGAMGLIVGALAMTTVLGLLAGLSVGEVALPRPT